MPALVRGLIVGALRHALHARRASRVARRSPGGTGALRAGLAASPLRRAAVRHRVTTERLRARRRRACRARGRYQAPLAEPQVLPPRRAAPTRSQARRRDRLPLGVARGAAARDLYRGADRGRHRHRRPARRARAPGLRADEARAGGGRRRAPGLLIPEVVELDEADCRARCVARADELAELGLVIEPFGRARSCVREVPALLGEIDMPRPGARPRRRAGRDGRGARR